MQNLSPKEKKLVVKLSTEGLSPAQVRLLKSIQSLLATVLASEEESEYFENSAELMKKTAELVKSANFPMNNKNMSYGEQALEFAIDSLHDVISENKLQTFDN